MTYEKAGISSFGHTRCDKKLVVKFWGDDDFNEHTIFFPTEIIFKTIGFEINPSGL